MRIFAGAVFTLTLFFLAACTSSSNAGGLTICRNLPTSSTCSVNLALLSCELLDDAGTPTGQSEVCLSDNANQCPDEQLVVNCTSRCANGDYAAACGGPSTSDGGSATVDPPSPSCKASGTLPGGTTLYCCPCPS